MIMAYGLPPAEMGPRDIPSLPLAPHVGVELARLRDEIAELRKEILEIKGLVSRPSIGTKVRADYMGTLAAIRALIVENNGFFPTMRALAERVGCTSANAHNHVRKLVESGHLLKRGSQYRLAESP